MKLVRWGETGAEKAGLVDDSRTLRDLSGTVADLSWQTLTPETLAQVAALDSPHASCAARKSSVGSPVSRSVRSRSTFSVAFGQSTSSSDESASRLSPSSSSSALAATRLARPNSLLL